MDVRMIIYLLILQRSVNKITLKTLIKVCHLNLIIKVVVIITCAFCINIYLFYNNNCASLKCCFHENWNKNKRA